MNLHLVSALATATATPRPGYPLAKQGRAGEALGASLMASGVDGIIGAIVFAILIPVLEPIIIAFSPAEFFFLALLGITFITFLAGGDSIFKGLALGYPAQARFMPLVVGLPGIGFTLFELIRETRRAPNETGETESSVGDSNTIALPDDVSRLIGQESMTVQGETPQMTPAELQKRERILLGYVTAMIAALIVFGFWVTVPAFIAVFLREREKADWRMTIGSAVAVMAVLYFVFYRGLGIDLHTGFITQWAWDILFPPE